MVCGNCGNCQNIQVNGERYSIACTRGVFELHESHVDNFQCEEYVEMPKVEIPRNNILIILKCGRDITVYDKNITCNDDMERRLHATSEWVEFDGMLINKREIAVLSYVHP